MLILSYSSVRVAFIVKGIVLMQHLFFVFVFGCECEWSHVLIDKKQTQRRSQGQIDWKDKEERRSDWKHSRRFLFDCMRSFYRGSCEVTCPSRFYIELFNNVKSSTNSQSSYKVMETAVRVKADTGDNCDASAVTLVDRTPAFLQMIGREQLLAASCTSWS